MIRVSPLDSNQYNTPTIPETATLDYLYLELTPTTASIAFITQAVLFGILFLQTLDSPLLSPLSNINSLNITFSL